MKRSPKKSKSKDETWNYDKRVIFIILIHVNKLGAVMSDSPRKIEEMQLQEVLRLISENSRKKSPKTKPKNNSERPI